MSRGPVPNKGDISFEGRTDLPHAEGRLVLPVTNIGFLLKVSVFRIPFSLSDVILNVSFFRDLTNDQNFFTFPLLFE